MNTQSELPPFDLIIEPLPNGMVLVGAKTTVGLDDLAATLSDHSDDGFASGLLCGGCAKELLGVILKRPVPDLSVARGIGGGYLFALDTLAERQALLDTLGRHIH